MSIDLQENAALLRGDITVEDAEPLLQWLQQQVTPAVDLGACTHLHAASLQCLMAAPVTVIAWPADDTLHAWLQAALCPAPARDEDNQDNQDNQDNDGQQH